MSNASPQGLSDKFAHWMALYAAYLFLAGWGYLRNFFWVFGVDAGWLDLGVNDTIAQGFSVLFGTGWLLSAVYLLVFFLSLATEVWWSTHGKKLDTFVAVVLVLLFPVTFWVARCAGIAQANKDRSDKTSLPTITFTSSKCSYRGKVVYIKSEALYVFDLAYLEVPQKPDECRFDLSGVSAAVPQLWLMRAPDMSDVRVVHYAKEAIP
ncbi:MAG TPA: hypothetical protein VND65_11250 [Candidatus Binatia bacterium]|nr:hypothetical protein [Candidatus Binatia bacterium]